MLAFTHVTCFSRVLQAGQPSRPETQAPDAKQPPGAAQSKAAGKRPARAPAQRPADIHVLVSEVGYETLSDKGKLAAALRTFKWRRQKSKQTNRVIVQADQVRVATSFTATHAPMHALAALSNTNAHLADCWLTYLDGSSLVLM